MQRGLRKDVNFADIAFDLNKTKSNLHITVPVMDPSFLRRSVNYLIFQVVICKIPNGNDKRWALRVTLNPPLRVQWNMPKIMCD